MSLHSLTNHSVVDFAHLAAQFVENYQSHSDFCVCRFPYPSVSEIMGLSSQTKFSEEQIKVWFSAQRLKHGVSWTPEEVGASQDAFTHHIHTLI